jgi:hypothetical protein
MVKNCMTITTYGEDKARSARRKKDRTAISSNYSDSLRDIAENQGNASGIERCRSDRAIIERPSTSLISLSFNGKLARQLRKHIQAQLAENAARRKQAVDQIAVCDQAIEELQQDLDNIEQIINQLDEAEQLEGTNIEQE